MVDSFVEAHNSSKRMSYGRVRHSVLNAAKPRSSLLIHTCGHEVTGLKTHRGPKRKEQFGLCSFTWLLCARSRRQAGMTDFEGRNFRLAGWIAERHTQGTDSSRTCSFLSIKKPPDRRQAMEHLRYPNQSTEYRGAKKADERCATDEFALLSLTAHFLANLT
jgi:hypothetical protein